MDKIVLIDGHSILNRAFYGLPDLTNAEGLHTNAIYGFLNILFKILEEEKPEYLTVAFDVHAPTFRHTMYAEYKGTRKPMAEELRQQVPVMKEVLRAMGIQTVEKEGLEADDLLGTISKRCDTQGMQVVIISGDRDLLQLATDTVKIRIPKTKRTGTEIEDYYADDVKERYQVTPLAFIDVKALMGDTSDNIPGVPGIGEKTATKIISEFGSIENAYQNIARVKPPRAAKNLEEYWEQAKMSKELAAICLDADVPFELEKARLGNLYTDEAYVLFQRLQFKNLLTRFEESTGKQNRIEEVFRTIRSRNEAEMIFGKAAEKASAGLVLFREWENVLPLFAGQSGLGGAALAFSDKEIYCLRVGQDLSDEWLKEHLEKLTAQIPRVSMFGWKEGLEWISPEPRSHCFDAKVAAYLLNPLKNEYGFSDIAQEYLNLLIDPRVEHEQSVCYEAYTALAAAEPMRHALKESGMEKLFEEVEMPLVFTLHEMEKTGVKVEGTELKKYGEELGSQITVLEKEIYEEAGEAFNINSPKQLGIVLFEHLGLPNGKKTKTGYSTAADVLEKLAAEYPIVSKILEYRQLTKLKSTYADGLSAYIDTDGRIHGKFHQTVTATGRISSTEPNLQNIPVRMELGRLIRKVFVPEEGYAFVDADYSQIELRVLAHCSGDAELIQAYREAKDIHRITASQVFHVPFEEVTPLQRRNAKAVNFGIVYGISSFGLSQDLSITRKEAAEYIERYFETYPGIRKFLDESVEQAKATGYAKTLFGRRRPVPELSSSNFMQRSFGERVAMNSPIQGTAADIIKIAMIKVNEQLKERKLRSRLVLQVHDELLVEAHKTEIDEVKSILQECMVHAASLAVPLEIDMHTGNSWYEAK